MRQLHPVSFHEQFLASGTYVWNSSNCRESWTIHRLPDQSQLIRVDRDERPNGISLLVEALRDSNGLIQRFDSRLNNPSAPQIKQVKASYIFLENRVNIRRQVNDQPNQAEELTLPDGIIIGIDTGIHVFTASVIQQVIAQGGRDIPVFAPARLGLDTDHALSGMILNYSVSWVGIETLTGFGDPISADHYQVKMRSTADLSDIWLDQTPMLLVYKNQTIKVTLKNYARSPDFKP